MAKQDEFIDITISDLKILFKTNQKFIIKISVIPYSQKNFYDEYYTLLGKCICINNDYIRIQGKKINFEEEEEEYFYNVFPIKETSSYFYDIKIKK